MSFNTVRHALAAVLCHLRPGIRVSCSLLPSSLHIHWLWIITELHDVCCELRSKAIPDTLYNVGPSSVFPDAVPRNLMLTSFLALQKAKLV